MKGWGWIVLALLLVHPAKAATDAPDPAWVREGYSIAETWPSPGGRFVAYALAARRGDYIHVIDRLSQVGTDIDSPDDSVIKAYLKKTAGCDGEVYVRRWREDVTWLKEGWLKVVYRLTLFCGVRDDGAELLVTRVYQERGSKGFRQVGVATFEWTRRLGG